MNVPSLADGERQTFPQTILQQPVSDGNRYSNALDFVIILGTMKWLYGFYLLTSIRMAVNCGNLPDPANGNVTNLGGTTFESLAEYRCIDGYKLSYPAGRTCLSSGLWSGMAQRCEPEPVCGKHGE